MPAQRLILTVTWLAAVAMAVLPGAAGAHVSQQGLVLLLPTDFYIGAGVAVVLLTLLLVLVLPASIPLKFFNSRSLAELPAPKNSAETVTSLLSLAVLFVLLLVGFNGTRDPLENLLPLIIWTVWWIAMPVMQGLIGDLWRWINPWTGVYQLAVRLGWRAKITLPGAVGCFPAVVIFLVFTSFALADIAPDVPRRLSWFVGGYWAFTLLCVMAFGKDWLQRGECFSILMHRYAQLSVIGRSDGWLKLGLPGWNLMANKTTSVSAAVFILVLLACGSFDGLNETFTWLAMIGVNPLAFPGRSAVINETVAGLLLTTVVLVLIYSVCIYAGLQIANRDRGAGSDGSINKVDFKTAFCALAVSLLPIAFVYHFAHYLVTFMVNGQYVLAALSDPLSNGADLLGLGSFYVSTGFLNTPASVKSIWLTQAGAVVFGHVVSVLLAHAISAELFGNARRAIVSQAPLAVFMVVYTFIGLWLLAAPRGA